MVDGINGNLHTSIHGVADEFVTERSRFELRFGGVREGCERSVVARETRARGSVALKRKRGRTVACTVRDRGGVGSRGVDWVRLAVAHVISFHGDQK